MTSLYDDIARDDDDRRRQPSGHALLDQAVREYQPSHVFALFSGGHDSLTATHLASTHPNFSGVVHVNTGIGVEETRQFVRDTCDRYGWPLLEYRAKEDCGQDYEEIVERFGFPGPPGHGLMYRRLKERCIRKLTRDHKTHRHDRIILISGCRSEESRRRMGTTEPIQRDGVRVWCAVIHNWTKADCLNYIDAHDLPENPVCDRLGMSGECLCGAFAHPGELDNLRFWYPQTAARIDRIEKRVRAAGHDWGWNDRPPRKPQRTTDDENLPLCWSCGKQ